MVLAYSNVLTGPLHTQDFTERGKSATKLTGGIFKGPFGCKMMVLRKVLQKVPNLIRKICLNVFLWKFKANSRLASREKPFATSYSGPANKFWSYYAPFGSFVGVFTVELNFSHSLSLKQDEKHLSKYPRNCFENFVKENLS